MQMATGVSPTCTIHLEGPPGALEQACPCRCGQTHRGDYAIYDHGRHNCLHSEPLMRFPEMDDWYVCGECGETFTSVLVEDLDTGLPKEGLTVLL